MLCSEKCPKGLDCKPLSNVVSEDAESFVCVGLHGEEKEFPKDIFRHCFRSCADTDSVFDYDGYDLRSVIATFSEALLIHELSDQS